MARQNGQAIVISAFGNNAEISAELESTCKSLVDSISFFQLKEGNKFAGTIFSGKNVIYYIAALILAIIIFIIKKSKKPDYYTEQTQPVYKSSSTNTYSGSLD